LATGFGWQSFVTRRQLMNSRCRVRRVNPATIWSQPYPSLPDVFG